MSETSKESKVYKYKEVIKRCYERKMKERLNITNPPSSQVYLKSWFDGDKQNYYNQAEVYAWMIKTHISGGFNTKHIYYDEMECSYFIWLSICYFNSHAALAIFKSLKNVEAYIFLKYGFRIKSTYPTAIYFAILAKYPYETWDNSMYDYFEEGDTLTNLTPGCILAWGSKKYLETGKGNTGHVGCVTSYISSNDKFKLCHSVPPEDDVNKKGGLVETEYSFNGYIVQSIRRESIVGGYLKFKCTEAANRFMCLDF